jgi:nitrate reductase beta subunit
MACKSTWTFSKGQEYMWWNNVETKPYGGYPQSWDVRLLGMLDEAHRKTGRNAQWETGQRGAADRPYGVYEGMTIFEAARNSEKRDQVAIGYEPTEQEWRSPNFYEDTATGSENVPEKLSMKPASLPAHATWFFYLQRLCNHCTYPACLSACPRGAVYKRPEDGIVLIDQSRCRGYRKCVGQCPYKKPMFRATTRVSEKCIACYPRIEGKDPLTEGEPMETRCMAAWSAIVCKDWCRSASSKWKEDRQPAHYLIKVEKVALPLYRNSARNPTAITSRRVGCRASICTKCSGRASMKQSKNTPIRRAN